jgi:L-malate glycosyltransferase
LPKFGLMQRREKKSSSQQGTAFMTISGEPLNANVMDGREPHRLPDVRRPSIFLMVNSLDAGGSERQFTFLANALDSNVFDVHLGCLRRKGALLSEIKDIAEFDVGGSFFTLQAQRARIALARHLRARKVVAAHSFDFYANLMLIPVARLAGIPVVIGSHRELGDIRTPLQFRAQAAVFRLCDRIVCNSQAAADRLIDHGLSESKLAVIPNMLAPEAFAETEPALQRRPDVLRVGVIACMNRLAKNHAGFLRAAAQLVQKLPNVEFLLVGDGPLRTSLEQLAQGLGLGGRVVFMGERRDIPAVLAAMDVSVLPALSNESLPNVILESMAAGVPVVATRVGGSPELIDDGKTGLLVPPDDEASLVAALERLLRQPELRMQCARQAKQKARDNFRLTEVCGRFEQLYWTLLEKKGLPAQSQPRRRA